MKVFRYEVPDDDQWHEITLAGPIVHTAIRDGAFHFWALAGAGSSAAAKLRLFGTGDEVPEDTMYRGTAITESGRLVLHLFEAALMAKDQRRTTETTP
jgi:hypothetical protein